jgi:hypothetical protein
MDLMELACEMGEQLGYQAVCDAGIQGRIWNENELYLIDTAYKAVGEGADRKIVEDGINVCFMVNDGKGPVGSPCTPFSDPDKTQTALHEIPDAKTFAEYLKNGRDLAAKHGKVPFSPQEIKNFMNYSMF